MTQRRADAIARRIVFSGADAWRSPNANLAGVGLYALAERIVEELLPLKLPTPPKKEAK